MSNINISRQIISELNCLSPEQKKRVLDFTKNISKPSLRGVSGKKLLRFAGSMTGREALRLKKIIREGCENTDAANW